MNLSVVYAPIERKFCVFNQITINSEQLFEAKNFWIIKGAVINIFIKILWVNIFVGVNKLLFCQHFNTYRPKYLKCIKISSVSYVNVTKS